MILQNEAQSKPKRLTYTNHNYYIHHVSLIEIPLLIPSLKLQYNSLLILQDEPSLSLHHHQNYQET